MVLLNSSSLKTLVIHMIGSCSGMAQAISRLYLGCIRPLSGEIIGVNEIDRLPEWILVSQILLRLCTARDVAMARCVCKHWNSLLNSMEFRHLWWGDCTDIEQWMIRSEVNMEPSETRWTAATRRCCDPGIAPRLQSPDGTTALPTVQLASSHGLACWVCHGRSHLLSIVVGNPRTRKWKLLPPLPVADDVPRTRNVACSTYSTRFIRHDLLAQTYTIFLLILFPVVQREFAFLYDSGSAAWQRIDRLPMRHDRFCTGLHDSSVVVIDFHYAHIAEGVIVDEVGIVAYDLCNNSWDEVSVKLRHPSHRSADTAAATRGGICYRLRMRRTSPIHHVSLCAHSKDECCRMLTLDHITGRMFLWQLDEKSTAFELVSSIPQHPRWPWPRDSSSDHAVGVGTPNSWTWVMRSDDSLFMAAFIYGSRSWLIVYDVGRSLWLMAHAYGDSSHLTCRANVEGWRWPILEYDVRWHDAHDIADSAAAAIGGRRPSTPAIAAVAATGGRRLHLVHAPDIWSSP